MPYHSPLRDALIFRTPARSNSWAAASWQPAAQMLYHKNGINKASLTLAQTAIGTITDIRDTCVLSDCPGS
jgi:hypothetical protein